jgi:hypothetical protein
LARSAQLALDCACECGSASRLPHPWRADSLVGPQPRRRNVLGGALAHGKQRSNEEDWLPLAGRLADAGYRAVIYNQCGVCAGDFDCSEGDDDLDGSWRDVVGAVRFARRTLAFLQRMSTP